MNNPSGMSRAELDLLASGLKPLPKGMKSRNGSKVTFDRSANRRRNRQARRARSKNRR